MQYDKDKKITEEHLNSGQEHTDLLNYLLDGAEQKPSINGESVVLSSDLLRYFNILMFE